MVVLKKSTERGGANLKFLIVMAVLGCGAYIGYLYIPVAYQAYMLKDLMQHNCDVAVAQGYAPAWVADQLWKSADEYGMPKDAVITPSQSDNRIQVRVQFTKLIEFPGYTYQYEFDQTARSTAFLTFK
jgi:hypothetical protein